MWIQRFDGRRARQSPRDILDISEGRRTDVTEALREDQVRARGTECRLIDLVQGLARLDSVPDHAARLAARLSFVLQKGVAYDWLLARRAGEVAFRRDADHVIAKAQGEADFGRRGEKGDDPHRTSPPR